MRHVYDPLKGPRIKVRVGNADAPAATVDVEALIDTGADRTTVDPTLVSELGLVSRGKEPLLAATLDLSETDQYVVTLSFSDGTVHKDLIVVRYPRSSSGERMLIGCDVLSRGILTCDGPKREFSLRFGTARKLRMSR